MYTSVCRKAACGRLSVGRRTALRMKPNENNEYVFHVLKTIQQDSSVALLLKKVIIGIALMLEIREICHMIFKGKIGVWFWLLLIGVNIAMVYEGIHEEMKGGEMLGLFFAFFLTNIICVPLVIRNYVQIDGEKLIFVLGFGRDYMKIEDITEVYRTHNPIAAGALSLDRIVIKAKRQEWIIAVHDKEQLFHELKRRNPKIQIRKSKSAGRE